MTGAAWALRSVLAFAAADAAAATTVDALGWMAGCWAFENEALRVEEQWMAPAGGLMLGVSRTLRDGRAVEHEFLLLRAQEGVVTLTASPSGQTTTTFTAVTVTAREVVLANPTHDFPQRITYRLRPDGGMLARVEGVAEGKEKAFDLSYRPVPCGSTHEP